MGEPLGTVTRRYPDLQHLATSAYNTPMHNIITCLWYAGEAEAAANFYTSLLPDSSVDRVLNWPAGGPPGTEGTVLTVEFTLLGQKFFGLNGGPMHKFNEAVSLQIPCEDQSELDRLWDALTANGGEPVACGWLKDRWGLCWQITPTRLTELMHDPDPARAARAMQAMMTMTKIDIAALEFAVG